MKDAEAWIVEDSDVVWERAWRRDSASDIVFGLGVGLYWV